MDWLTDGPTDWFINGCVIDWLITLLSLFFFIALNNECIIPVSMAEQALLVTYRIFILLLFLF